MRRPAHALLIAVLATALAPVTAYADDCSNLGDCYGTAGSAAGALGFLGLAIAFLYGIRAVGIGGGGEAGKGQGPAGAGQGDAGSGTGNGSPGRGGGKGGGGGRGGGGGGAGAAPGAAPGAASGADPYAPSSADYGAGGQWEYRPVPGGEGQLNASVQRPDGTGDGYYTDSLGHTSHTWHQSPNGDGTFHVDFFNADGSVRMQATISPNPDGTATITATNADGSSSQHVAVGNHWVASNGSVDPHPGGVPPIGDSLGDAASGSSASMGGGEATGLDTQAGSGTDSGASDSALGPTLGSSAPDTGAAGATGGQGSIADTSAPSEGAEPRKPFESGADRADPERRTGP